jgi:hypothetical protein
MRFGLSYLPPQRHGKDGNREDPPDARPSATAAAEQVVPGGKGEKMDCLDRKY